MAKNETGQQGDERHDEQMLAQEEILTCLQSIERELKMVRFRAGILVFFIVGLPIFYFLLILLVGLGS